MTLGMFCIAVGFLALGWCIGYAHGERDERAAQDWMRGGRR
jgi:hypothetical protein